MSFISVVNPSPTFSLGVPSQGLPGSVSETPESMTDSAICLDAAGLMYGIFAATVPTAAGVGYYQQGGGGITTPRQVQRPSALTGQKIAGVVRRIAGKPRDFIDTTDVGYKESCGIVRRGRMWMLCETAITDPTLATDSFWARVTVHGGLITLGSLRYGDGDPVAGVATCLQLPISVFRPIQAVTPGGIGLFEFDFSHNIAFA